ncbi:MAG: hypothetical protein Q4D60_00090 [Eubacteriales bacterium]|nr:hypothetical protein [Eubacteriales bacterium]
MKKLCYIMTDVMTAAFLGGAWTLQYFSKRKLGMSRWVGYQTSKWKERLPLEALRLLVPLVLLLFLVIIIRHYWKKRKSYKKIVHGTMVLAVGMSILCLGIILVNTPETMRAYYLVFPLLSAACILQMIKLKVTMAVCKK